ncbi:class I SAM-dependent methyltransferase [Chamaesiphon minutus]|uniref:Methylase involved in ubiquinone/menaquinone biosynthesis n=1 Tax=Chamaesiphon minutus (strain ATCC 27169 / PCC 6605) TaxID=1173020 RepID=K9UBJ8_CHAP6|nr:class I SAM-dependent methyltransferase [Chamaesiphon minutus]AFY92008.1 methylase involved in ubiquinone/menaquinone biosynthesis [Chamaesiphon minutus PCC 6605]
MTTTIAPTDRLVSQLVNSLLGIKPLAKFAKDRARNLIIKRAEAIGVAWRDEVKFLRSRGGEAAFSPQWEADLAQITNPALKYPEYYLTSFHAYDRGNMSWDAAMEVEVAAYSVHAKIFAETGKTGDAQLRQSYHDLVTKALATPPERILDIGCSVGMSTFAMQEVYPQAHVTGLDLSPYFLSIANYRAQQTQAQQIDWVHAAGEATGLPAQSYDLVSLFLICHELPQSATREIFQEAKRLLKPGGHIAIMDMNPASEIYSQMAPYILTLLKSTEPYLDRYFTLDISQALIDAGFEAPTITPNTPRHRTVIAKVK